MLLKLVLILGLAASTFAMQNLIEVATSLNATQLAALVTKASLGTSLNGKGPFTILVPTDEAFAKVPSEDMAKLANDPAALTEVLKYHILEGEVFSWDLVSGMTFTSLNGHTIRVYVTSSGEIHFNNAKVLKVDVEATNGVVYLIDTVLDVPEGTILQILENPAHNLSTFLKFVKAARYDRAFNSTISAAQNRYTVFAPSDAAFAKLDQATVQRFLSSPTLASELVRYHIHMGTMHYKSIDHPGRITTLYAGHYIHVDVSDEGGVTLNKVAHLDETDIEAENGVVHVVSHVLIPVTLGSIVG